MSEWFENPRPQTEEWFDRITTGEADVPGEVSGRPALNAERPMLSREARDAIRGMLRKQVHVEYLTGEVKNVSPDPEVRDIRPVMELRHYTNGPGEGAPQTGFFHERILGEVFGPEDEIDPANDPPSAIVLLERNDIQRRWK